jgi:thioesterase domain-containing protein
MSYNPASYAGALTLIRSSATSWEQNDPSLGWSGLAVGRLKMHEIEGDHYSIVTGSNVNLLAALLEQQLAERSRSAVAVS